MIEIHWSPLRTTCAVVCMDEEPIRLSMVAFGERDNPHHVLVLVPAPQDGVTWMWEVAKTLTFSRPRGEREIERIALTAAIDAIKRHAYLKPWGHMAQELARMLQERNHG